MSDPAPEPKSSSVVKCEKHGLHYDSSKMSGCVICRREAGGGSVARPAPSAGSAGPAGRTDSGSLGQALGVTAILLALTTAALFFMHGFVAETFQSRNRPRAGTFDTGFDRQMHDMGLTPDSEADDQADTEDGYSGPEDSGEED